MLVHALLACRPAEDPPRPGAQPHEVDPPTRPEGDTPTVPRPLVRFTDGRVPRNLLFVTLDTARRDHVGRLGGTDSTPNLDRVLAEGVALEDHRSCANWTLPSMSCLLTGQTPLEQGWFPWSDDVPDTMADLPTLAALLSPLGWQTTVVTASTVFAPAPPDLTAGFERTVLASWQPAAEVVDVALVEARSLSDRPEPFYLHVHFVDPHASYCPPEEFVDPEYEDLGYDLCTDAFFLAGQLESHSPEWQRAFLRSLEELYDAEIESWDHALGRLWTELDAMGALDDTLVVFATDHGEQLVERGELGHGKYLGAEEVRAVGGFWAKNLEPVAWPYPTVHQDVAAALHDLYGLPPVGTVLGLAPRDRAIRAMNHWSGLPVELSVVRDGGQLCYDFAGERAYYDLVADERGLVNAYDPSAEAVIGLWDEMAAFVAEVESAWPQLGPPILAGP